MFVLTDLKNRIEAFNESDMSENSGWVEISNTINEPLTDSNGALIYRVENGGAVEIPAEQRENPPQPQTQPTAEERLSAAEDAIDALTELL